MKTNTTGIKTLTNGIKSLNYLGWNQIIVPFFDINNLFWKWDTFYYCFSKYYSKLRESSLKHVILYNYDWYEKMDIIQEIKDIGEL